MPKDLSPQSRPELASFNWEDPFSFETQLTEDERMLRDAAKTYAQDKLQPRIIDAYRDAHTDAEIMFLSSFISLTPGTLSGDGGEAETESEGNNSGFGGVFAPSTLSGDDTSEGSDN